jgi:hypothetical protein
MHLLFHLKLLIVSNDILLAILAELTKLSVLSTVKHSVCMVLAWFTLCCGNNFDWAHHSAEPYPRRSSSQLQELRAARVLSFAYRYQHQRATGKRHMSAMLYYCSFVSPSYCYHMAEVKLSFICNLLSILDSAGQRQLFALHCYHCWMPQVEGDPLEWGWVHSRFVNS